MYNKNYVTNPNKTHNNYHAIFIDRFCGFSNESRVKQRIFFHTGPEEKKTWKPVITIISVLYLDTLNVEKTDFF